MVVYSLIIFFKHINRLDLKFSGFINLLVEMLKIKKLW